MTDVRALQILLDAGVTDPRALFAALPSGTAEDAGRAIDVLSRQAFTPAEEDDPECDCRSWECCELCATADDWRQWNADHAEDR